MKVGQKITVHNIKCRPFDAPRFLRCYITRITGTFVQAYDPVRNWSWGWYIDKPLSRVMCMS